MNLDSDEHLVRYLLGDLPDNEAERLDQRGIADDTFALRLRALENELVDRYVRGEPGDLSLERFARLYRNSAHLREKIRFAEALHALAAQGKTGSSAVPTVRPSPRLWVWSVGTAAGLLMAVAGYLLFANFRLRDGIEQLQARQAAVETRNARLQQEIERTRPGNAPPPSPVTPTFLLRPPRRGLREETKLAVPKLAEQVVLRLPIETNEYAAFWAALRNPDTGGIVWRTPDVPSEPGAGVRTVSITIPVSSLHAQRYAVELSGISRSGPEELIGTYVIRVVLE
jgi:hypothetical protein